MVPLIVPSFSLDPTPSNSAACLPPPQPSSSSSSPLPQTWCLASAKCGHPPHVLAGCQGPSPLLLPGSSAPGTVGLPPVVYSHTPTCTSHASQLLPGLYALASFRPQGFLLFCACPALCWNLLPAHCVFSCRFNNHTRLCPWSLHLGQRPLPWTTGICVETTASRPPWGLHRCPKLSVSQTVPDASGPSPHNPSSWIYKSCESPEMPVPHLFHHPFRLH